MSNGTIIITEGRDEFFLHHRLHLANRIRSAGFNVIVAANCTGLSPKIRELGFQFIDLKAHRGGLSVTGDLALLFNLYKLFRLSPQLIHLFTIKPVALGGLVSLLFPSVPVVNSITGLGYLFTDMERAKLARLAVSTAFKLCRNRKMSQVIVQNSDDFEQLASSGLVNPTKMNLIRGSGVDIARFSPTPEPPGPIRVLFLGRLLRDKGVLEFLEAAALVKKHHPQVTFSLVGEIDRGHPTHIDEKVLSPYTGPGIVDYLGHSDEVSKQLQEHHLLVLPSYREGLPKVVLEASACQRASIVADVPGCREIVRHEQNGLLVPARDAKSLADAIERLVTDQQLRLQLAENARKIVESEHSIATTCEAIVKVYEKFGLNLSTRHP